MSKRGKPRRGRERKSERGMETRQFGANEGKQEAEASKV